MRRLQPSPTPPRPICCSCYAGACTSPPAARVWALEAALRTFWPRCGACVHASPGSPPIHAPAWRCCGDLGFGHSMAVVTKRVWGWPWDWGGRRWGGREKQRLGKVYALDETPNSRKRVRRVRAMGGWG